MAATLRQAREPQTFEELYRAIEALPEGITGEILTPGVLTTMGRPGSSHRYSARQLLTELVQGTGRMGPPGRWLEVEPEVRLGRDRLAVPDMAGWRLEGTPDFLATNPISTTPDWCCEILSPSTGRADRLLKMPLYLRSGVAHVWLVDPVHRLVEVYVGRDGVPALIAGSRDDEPVVLPPFDLPLNASTLWLRESEPEP